MAKKNTKKQIEQYEHSNEERANIPHVGLVTPTSDPETGEKKKYQYDPHLDPQLQWTGKAEHTSFEVPTVSLHVHERIDPKTIIESVKKATEEGGQFSLFSEKKPLREALDFYKHKEGWSNRLIAGDSLLVMNSLLEKEGMREKVQMIYFDPPYGIKYKSNFQPFTSSRAMGENDREGDLTAEPEMIKAFRDTWELGIHSYLNYARDRFKLASELLSETGSIFVQISDENVHLMRNLLDEIFGPTNFVVDIIFTKTGSKESNKIEPINDHLLWYTKDSDKVKYRRLFVNRDYEDLLDDGFKYLEDDGTISGKIPINYDPERVVRYDPITSDGFRETTTVEVEFDGRKYFPGSKNHWKTSVDGLKRLDKKGRLVKKEKSLQYLRKLSDYPVKGFSNLWYDLGGASGMVYVVQTNPKVVERAMIMTTDPGDIVLDITCGSGTTAYVAEQYGRKWITCDTSRVALTLAKQRLMTSYYPYYELAQPNEGVSSGLKYREVNHITLGQIANNQSLGKETLFDQPIVNTNKARVTGPFTVEAVPAPHVSSFDELEKEDTGSDTSIARSGETNRQTEWRDELMRAGVRAKGGKMIEFSRVEPLAGTKFIQAEAETKEDTPKRVLIVFGPEHAPLEQRTVENAWQEARSLRPDLLLFCAFQFDEEAAKDIDELTPEIAGMQLLKAQMNADMLTDELRKKRSSNESFWLIGQPDIKVHKADGNKIIVEVMGFDYYNPKTGDVESGGKNNIAMWMLDTDYDDRSLFPSQVFFPMAGSKNGWSTLAKNLQSEIDLNKINAFKGTESLPFDPGEKVAVKIIDDRGIESLRIISL